MRLSWQTAYPTIFVLLSTLIGLVEPISADTKPGAGGPKFKIDSPSLILTDIGFSVDLTAVDADGEALSAFVGTIPVQVGEQSFEAVFTPESAGSATVSGIKVQDSGTVEIQVGASQGSGSIRCIPGYVSILPPLLAILLAFVFRQVLVALVAGIWLGALFALDGSFAARSLAVVDTYIITALADPGRASIIVFTMLLGAMVGVISRAGGTLGIVQALSHQASSRKMGQITTWVLGIFVFFDDYANSLIVGNTMRPVCDRLKISREKLAYIVDSTAAPVASIALVSTWIGTEVGYIQGALANLPGDYQSDAYGVFLESILFRFYPILALVFGFMIAYMGRDLFSMRRAEERALHEGKLFRDGADLASGGEDEVQQPDPETPCRWYNGVIPIVLVILVTMVGLWVTGVESVDGTIAGLNEQIETARESSPDEVLGLEEQLAHLQTEYEGGFSRIRTVVGSADSYKALLWASFLGALAAILLAFTQRILSIGECMRAVTSGFKAMLPAILILILAWSIAQVTSDLQTDKYLIAVFTGKLRPELLPVVVFVTAAIMSFSTGTSWGTMGILMPLVVPLAHGLSVDAGLEPDTVHLIILGAVSSVLSGAVFGDHCSPISDTTIMSSMATGCDHIDHVKTQLPYALLVGVVAMVLGDIPTAYGVHPVISLILGSILLFCVVRFFGKKVEAPGAS